MDYREPSEEQKNRWQNDPNNWVWGMFYYNPEDPRLFPPKKFKELGWTTNFANPKSVLALLLIIAPPLIIIFLAR